MAELHRITLTASCWPCRPAGECRVVGGARDGSAPRAARDGPHGRRARPVRCDGAAAVLWWRVPWCRRAAQLTGHRYSLDSLQTVPALCGCSFATACVHPTRACHAWQSCAELVKPHALTWAQARFIGSSKAAAPWHPTRCPVGAGAACHPQRPSTASHALRLRTHYWHGQSVCKPPLAVPCATALCGLGCSARGFVVPRKFASDKADVPTKQNHCSDAAGWPCMRLCSATCARWHCCGAALCESCVSRTGRPSRRCHACQVALSRACHTCVSGRKRRCRACHTAKRSPVCTPTTACTAADLADVCAGGAGAAEAVAQPPDLGSCLLQQKLQMVALCIARRAAARRGDATTPTTAGGPCECVCLVSMRLCGSPPVPKVCCMRTSEHEPASSCPDPMCHPVSLMCYVYHHRAAKRWQLPSDLSSDAPDAMALDSLDGWDADELTLNGSRYITITNVSGARLGITPTVNDLDILSLLPGCIARPSNSRVRSC
jgi:hypothetical protein